MKEMVTMGPLVMSSSREENAGSSVEEFATHLSLYDDTFQFVDKSTGERTLSVPDSMIEDTKGPLPPSVFGPASKKTDDVTEQVKVKRKCGRPRNPIPRHKRESHINAEHRRRGKIQDGFRTLKNIVPKYEQTSGRDSKADILFKAVDYSKLLQRDISEINSTIERLKTERDALSVDIKNYRVVVPDVSVYEEVGPSLEDRYADYIHMKTKEHWTFSTFKVIMRPLFESYKLSIRDRSTEDFLHSVADWATSALSMSNLSTVCINVLRDIPAESYGTISAQETSVSEAGHYGPAGFVVPSVQGGDSNNNSHNHHNHCLNSLAFSADHQFGCRDGAGSTCSSVGAGPGEMGSTTTDHAHTTPQASSLTKGGQHVSSSHYHELLPFSGNTLHCSTGSSNIFSDLHLNLDHDLHHHHHLGFTSSLDPWQHHRLQTHPHQYNHSEHFSHINHFSEKPHPTWASPPHSGIGEFSPRHTACHHHLNSFSDRDFKSDQTRSHESTGSLPNHVQRAGLTYPTHYNDHTHKRQSRSSSDSEGSALNMGTFVKQASETLADQDKYGQQSPSLESCVSPSSNTYVGSPVVVSGQGTGDPTFSYHSPSLDHYIHHQSLLQEKMDSANVHNWTTSRLSVSLPSYRETFGTQTNVYHRHSITNFDGDVKSHWVTNTADNFLVKGLSHPQSTDRFEPSSLLAELLSQQTSLPPLKASRALTDITSSLPSDVSFMSIPVNHNYSVTDTTNSINHSHSSNGLSVLPKPDNPYWPVSILDQGNLTGRSYSSEEPLPSHSFQEGRSVANHNNLPITDVKPLSSWSNPGQTHTALSMIKAKNYGKDHESQATAQNHQVSYFELAHQELLKNHVLSYKSNYMQDFHQANRKIHHLHNPTSDFKEESHSFKLNLETESDVASSRNGTPVAIFSQEHTSPQRSSLTSTQVSGKKANSNDKTALQRIGRKSSFEESFPKGQSSIMEVSGCKKSCHWQHLSQSRDHCDIFESTDGKLPGLLHTKDTICVDKSFLGAFGETPARF